MKVRETAAVVAVAVLLLACANGPGDPVPTRKFGDGTWEATAQIPAGTYVTANASPHADGLPCQWTVAKSSNRGTVILHSRDPGETIQRVYIGPGDVFTTSRCGTWAFESKENLTQSATAS